MSESHGWQYLTEASTIELFDGIRADVELLSLGSYFAELVDYVSADDTEAGELLSFWSSFSREGYEELIARSDNGELDGNWTVDEKPLAGGNGGHGMIFRDFAGKLHFVMHQPNTSTKERPVILSLAETETGLALRE